jgi:hypothetical protein
MRWTKILILSGKRDVTHWQARKRLRPAPLLLPGALEIHILGDPAERWLQTYRMIDMRAFPAAILVTIAGLTVPGPAAANSCGERAERMRAAIQTDVRKRQIAEGVAKDLLPQVEKAATLCRSGKVSDGERALDTITKKFGYR